MFILSSRWLDQHPSSNMAGTFFHSKYSNIHGNQQMIFTLRVSPCQSLRSLNRKRWLFLRCPQVLSPRCCRDLATATCVVPQFLAMCGVNFEYLWLSPHLFPKVFIRPMVRTILMFLKCKCTIGPIGFPNMLFSFVDVVWTHRIAQSCSWDDPNLQGFWGEA